MLPPMLFPGFSSMQPIQNTLSNQEGNPVINQMTQQSGTQQSTNNVQSGTQQGNDQSGTQQSNDQSGAQNNDGGSDQSGNGKTPKNGKKNHQQKNL